MFYPFKAEGTEVGLAVKSPTLTIGPHLSSTYHQSLLIIKGDNRGNSALTKWFYGFNSHFENGSGLCLHGSQDEVGTTKHDWSARCQYNVTG